MPKKYRVIKDYQSPYPDPIIFYKGEQTAIGKKFEGDPDWRHWAWCTAEGNRQARVPLQYFRIKEKPEYSSGTITPGN